MRVLMINSVCGIRSTGRICTDLAEVLEQQGHQVKIAYGRENVPEQFKKYAVRIESNMGIKLHGMMSRLLDMHGFGSVRTTRRFIEWIKSYDPDVIHLHNIHGYYINIELLFQYLRTCGKRIIWTLHDCWAFTGHCSHFDYIGCEKWKTECAFCPQLKEYPRSLFYDGSRRNYRRKCALFCGIPNMIIVTPSEWLACTVRQGFLREYPVQVIYNGIDLSVFKPTDSNFKKKNDLQDKKIILGVSSVWNKKKGFDDFIQLSNLIDDSYRIVLVGLNENQKAKLTEKMLGIQRTNNLKELCEIYTAADAFVNPSVEETMGLTTAEALACGTPVIVYNRTAVPEVPDKTCGIVLSENTPTAIAESLSALNFKCEACLRRAKDFDKKEKYQEYIDLYQIEKFSLIGKER